MNAAMVALIRKSGRSWWQALYRDGHVLSEWETQSSVIKLPGIGSGATSRWEEVPKRGMVRLRLLCPDAGATAGELESADGRFIQLKHGRVMVGINGAKSGRVTDTHLIGRLQGDKGAVLCYAWEPPQAELRDRRPIVDGHGRMEEYVVRPFRAGQLVHFEDNVFDMKYKGIGRIAIEPQQVVA